ncbi:MAG TPA: chemotaxis protein CheW, partial [Pseudomonadota bacterium]|nr:chemotaxis protein CheW [Pseudomonadota bacterium]
LAIRCHERTNTQLELVIADDGRGIDRVAVARRAGRPLPESDAELLELLCLPGLSTRDEATKTSGRGLGMDIVKRIVTTDLRGEMTLKTVLGRGTTFTLRLPLTLTIVDVFLVECGRERFVVPVSAIEEIIDVDPSKRLRGPLPESSPLWLYEWRDEGLTLIELGAALQLPSAAGAAPQGLVVRRTGQGFVFVIDRVIGQQEVVVRPIDDPLAQAPGVSGATDLGDGRPALVLDLIALSTGLYRRPAATEVRG